MLELLSIILEAAIVVVCLMAAQSKKKRYSYGLALTFGMYVVFDSARRFSLSVPQGVLDILFLIATIAAFWAVWSIYKAR